MGSQSAGSDDQHTGIHDFLLSLYTDILQEDMPRIALYLIFCKIKHNFNV
jgi:hypothetical protein